LRVTATICFVVNDKATADFARVAKAQSLADGA
jgi:hypothetical protein